MIVLSGCAWATEEGGPGGDQLEESAGQDIDAEVGESYWFEVRMTEQNQNTLVTAQPPFEFENSLERENLIQRYQHLNDQNNVHHVYLLSMDGKVISYYTAQGKVSSVNSKLTNDKQIVREPDCSFSTGDGAGSEGACYKTVESPQMDGSYGENGDAVFFFTTAGEYVEWNGWYLVSEEPRDIQTPVTIVEEAGEEPVPEDVEIEDPEAVQIDESEATELGDEDLEEFEDGGDDEESADDDEDSTDGGGSSGSGYPP